MMKNIFYKSIKILVLFLLVFQLSFVLTPFAQADDYGLDAANSVAQLNQGEDSSSASNSISLGIGKILGSVLAFLGIIFLILVIVGGLMWMTSAGNDQTVAKAKNLLVAAVVGLVIVLSAYAITAYIGDTITK